MTPELLLKAGLARGDKIKILGTGELTRKHVVHAHAFSETARNKIALPNMECKVIE